MHKNDINLENFKKKLVIIFLEHVTMVSPMSFLGIHREWQDGTGHVVASSCWLHSL
jgi:hypothetical protein